MSKRAAIRTLFGVGAIYDGLLGLAFLLGGPGIFERSQITPPNHFGYVQFPAALLLIFALMYLAIARNPTANRNLIPYGILLKVAYCGVIFFYWFTSDLPYIWKPFAVADIIFLALFIWAFIELGAEEPEAPVPG